MIQTIGVRSATLWFVSMTFLLPAKADRSIETVLVNLSDVTFTFNPACAPACTATINMSFEFYQQVPWDVRAQRSPAYGMLPGTFKSSSRGFLGPFDSLNGVANFDQMYMPFLDAAGDELDIDGHTVRSFADTPLMFRPGEYDLAQTSTDSPSGHLLDLYTCFSCESFNYPHPSDLFPTSGRMTVTRVPESGGTLTFLAADLFGLAILVLFIGPKLSMRG